MELTAVQCVIITLLALEIGAIKEVKKPPKIFRESPKEVIFRSDQSRDQTQVPVSLYCEARGHPTPRYVWEVNGRLLHFGGAYRRIGRRGTIAIGDLGADREGFYQCKASNDHGVALSPITHLRQAVNVAFPTEQVTRQDTAIEDSPYTLHCNPPSGSVPTPSYAWVRATKRKDTEEYFPVLSDGGRVSIDGEGNIHFAYVKMTDAVTGRYTYKCAIVNPIFHSSNYGSPTKLFVRTGPGSGMDHAPKMMWSSMNTLGDEETAITALRGHNITIQCIFSGKPVPQIMWSKMNGVLPMNRYKFDIDDPKFQNIIINNVKYEDAGTYYCAGVSPAGQNRHRVDVQVEAAPYWANGPPKERYVVEGDSASFYCTAYGKPKPSVEFLINGVRVAGLPPNHRRVVYEDNIIFLKLNKSDLQVVQCNVSNKHGYLFADAFLNVVKKTIMTVAPKDVYLGKTLRVVKFMCDGVTDTSTDTIISWFIDNKLVTNGTAKVVIDNSGRVLTVDTRIAKEYVDKKYTCVISNGHNSSVQASAVLHYTALVPLAGSSSSGKASNWWVGVILGFVVALLLAVACLLYTVYKKRTGTYSVDKKERSAGYNPERELSRTLFRAYSRQDLEPIKGRRCSIIEAGSSSTLYDDDEDDESVGGYSDINTERFQEDGSFLGKYTYKKKQRYEAYDNHTDTGQTDTGHTDTGHTDTGQTVELPPIESNNINHALPAKLRNYENIENCIHSVL